MRVWDSEGGRSLWYCMCVFLLVFCSLGFYRPLLPASALLLYITSNKSLAVNLLQQTKMRVFIRHRPLTGTLVSIFIFFYRNLLKSHIRAVEFFHVLVSWLVCSSDLLMIKRSIFHFLTVVWRITRPNDFELNQIKRRRFFESWLVFTEHN